MFTRLLKRIAGGHSASKERVVTRVAPSPTGALHLGTTRTALFNYLWARKHNGTFILRSEDTDQQRSEERWEHDICDGLAWLGIEWDAFYRQSTRTHIYSRYLTQLLSQGTAYRSREPSKADPETEVEVIRIKNPNTTITFHDRIRGDVSFDTTELGDFVIARNIEAPLYHFAVVVDDHDMGVTDVIRGEDHISNTPRQIIIQDALGFSRPRYAHIPLILANDRSKLSKRKGTVAISTYRERGYLPEALVNYLALLGWNPGTDQEIFELNELIAAFDLAQIQKGGAVFDPEKLDWFNREHMKRLSLDTFRERVHEMLPAYITELPGFKMEILDRMLPILQERIATFHDVAELAAEEELTYFFSRPDYTAEDLIWKDTPRAETRDHLTHIVTLVDAIPSTEFTESRVKKAVWDYATESGRGAVLWPMRYALSGKDRSPDPFTLADILGKQETIARLNAAIAVLES